MSAHTCSHHTWSNVDACDCVCVQNFTSGVFEEGVYPSTLSQTVKISSRSQFDEAEKLLKHIPPTMRDNFINKLKHGLDENETGTDKHEIEIKIEIADNKGSVEFSDSFSKGTSTNKGNWER